MKILFVASTLHFEGHGGANTHTRAILGLFKTIEGAEVKCLALPLPHSWAPQKFRQASAIITGLVSGEPSKSRFFLDRKALLIFRNAMEAEHFDAVVFNSADLLPLSRHLGKATPCILVSHNVETEIIRGQIERLGAPRIIRNFLKRDIRNTSAAEVDGAKRCALIITISTEDAKWYRHHIPNAEIITVPSAFSQPPYSGGRPPNKRPLQIGYLADLNWWPNREGAEWLVETILPKLPVNAIEVHFFGSGSEAYERRLPMLRGHGYVDNLDSLWNSANFTISPIFSGSGVNIKLVESLYNGVPALATPHASRGLPPLSDPALMIVQPEEWLQFLQSERAVELANSRVRKETSDLFSRRSYASLVADRMRHICGSARDANHFLN